MDEVKRSNTSMIVGGLLFIILGILCVVFRNAALTMLAIVAGVCFAAAGIGGLVNYGRYKDTKGYTNWMLVGAILNLVLGAVFILYPFAFRAVIPWLIGLVVLVVGITEIASALKSRKENASSWGYDMLIGILTAIFGILMFAAPGLLSILLGIFLIMRGFIMLGGGLAFGKMFA